MADPDPPADPRSPLGTCHCPAAQGEDCPLTEAECAARSLPYIVAGTSDVSGCLGDLMGGAPSEAQQIATLRAELQAAQDATYPGYKREKALRCAVEADRARLQQELDRLREALGDLAQQWREEAVVKIWSGGDKRSCADELLARLRERST